MKNSIFFIIFVIVSLLAFLHEPAREFSVLAINDVYRIDAIEDGAIGGFARFKTLRDQLTQEDPDLITLHGGDFLSPSILGQRYNGAQMIDIMNQIDGDGEAFDERFFVVPGNHEFDQTEEYGAILLRNRIDESDFWWVSSNILWSQGSHPEIIKGIEQIVTSRIIEAGGVKVGIFGLTLERDQTKYAPIDGGYIDIARTMTKDLRQAGAEVVIGLTHLLIDDDIDILNTLGDNGPDIIFGGHEHTSQFENINERYVVVADSDLVSATIAHFSLQGGNLIIELENKIIDESVAEDTAMQTKIDAWIARYNSEECGAQVGESCGDVALGHTAVDLVSSEGQNRRYETNTGSWFADLMRGAFEDDGAQIAFINSGAIRKNEDIAAGTGLTKTILQELLPYDPKLYFIEISGAELKSILNHAVHKWPGYGYWLQVSGMAFRHNVEDATAEDIMLIEKDGSLRPISDNERIRAVTVGYILNTDGPQDGYTMLNKEHIITSHHNEMKLIDFAQEYLLGLGDTPIAPQIEGRICNPNRPQYCLLDNR